MKLTLPGFERFERRLAVDDARASVLIGPPPQPEHLSNRDPKRFIEDFVSAHPDGSFTDVLWNGEQQVKSNRELYEAAKQVLRQLRSSAEPGASDVILSFHSTLDLVAATWACILGGYDCLPGHVHRFGSPSNNFFAKLANFQSLLNEPVLVTTRELGESLLASGSFQFRDLIFTDELPAGPVTPDTLGYTERAGSFLLGTSGTTGSSKLLVLQHGTLLLRALGLSPFEQRPSIMSLLPWDGTSSLGLVFPLTPDSFYVQPDCFAGSPLQLLNVAERHRIECISMSSSLVARLNEALRETKRNFDLSSLRHVGFGAEMVVPAVVLEMDELLRRHGADQLSVTFLYGMTEMGNIFLSSTLPARELLEVNEPMAAESTMGTCSPGISVRLVNDAGVPVPWGEEGNIEAIGKEVQFSAYRNQSGHEDHSFTEDGWFKTGDRGRIESGGLRVTGRQKAIIIINGHNYALEAIEAPLKPMAGILRSLVAAVAVRSAASVTDELAIFFVPGNRGEAAIDTTCMSIRREISRRLGLALRHVVPVPEGEFPLTPTNKIRRGELVREFQLGRWASRSPAEQQGAARKTDRASNWLRALWSKVLKLDSEPPEDDNFYDLGGDSLAAAQLIFAVETKLGRELNLEAFFGRPTLAGLTGLVEKMEAAPNQRKEGTSREGPGLLRALQTYVGSWKGQRAFEDGLVVGKNVSGRKRPMFWVCQDFAELEALAVALGAEQPIFGMRSLVNIVEVEDHTTDVIEAVTNRYLWEILALDPPGSFVLGGNCQGAIFALAMARRLKQFGRTPAPLVLMEWSFAFGRYDGPVYLFYGDKSYTAEIYLAPDNHDPDWRADFPDRELRPITGTHGSFFHERNVGGLRDALTEAAERY